MLRLIRKRLGRAAALFLVFTFALGVLPVPAQFAPEMPLLTNPEKQQEGEEEGSGHPLLSKAAAQRLINVNFRDAPLDQVLTFYSELVGRTLLKSPGINATITLRGTTKLTTKEALEAIESVLTMNNVALVPMGDKFLKVVAPTAVRQDGMKIEMELPDKPFPETDQLISQIIPLRYLEIAEAQQVVQGFLHGYGKIQPLERANSLLITETSVNLKRILEILELIDQPTEARVETRIYELKYAEAAKIASKLNELIQESQGTEEKPQIATPVPVPKTPAGVIRARASRSVQAAARKSEVEAALAERGIVQGKVKIIADDRTNILIVIARPANFTFFDKIVAILDRPVEPDVVVRVLALEFAKAEEIASILNEFVGAASAESKTGAAAAGGEQATEGGARSQALEAYVARRAAATDRIRKTVTEEKAKIGQLSPNTRILADKRTNSLLLMGTKGDIAALLDVIDKLDTMLAQVLIESAILEIVLSKNVEYGVDWLQQSMTAYNVKNTGAGGGVSVREPVYSFGGGQNLSGATFRDGGSITRENTGLSAGALTYYATMFDLNIDVVLRMAASSSDARVLATPVILTMDNTEATINIGEERPVVTSTSTSTAGQQTSAYEYRNIGINLKVTPRINPQRYVVMEIEQTADNVGGFEVIDNNRVPIITKREMQASIAVPSRGTIVLGGLVSMDMRNTRSKIPILGDIPIIGVLFRMDTRDKDRTEIMVMLTPYVLMTPDEARAETLRLHRATHLSEQKWYRGWSDSELARPTWSQQRAKKRDEKEAQKRQIEGLMAARDELERSDEPVIDQTPRISVVVPSDIPLDDLRDPRYQRDVPEEMEVFEEETEEAPVSALGAAIQERAKWEASEEASRSETPEIEELIREPAEAVAPRAEEPPWSPATMAPVMESMDEMAVDEAVRMAPVEEPEAADPVDELEDFLAPVPMR